MKNDQWRNKIKSFDFRMNKKGNQVFESLNS